MDISKDFLVRICKEQIAREKDIIRRFESEDNKPPKEIYDIAKEMLPEYEAHLAKIEAEWPE